MKLKILGTGSKGNCYVIQGYEETLILECGVDINTILKGIGFNVKGVSCLLTHEHKDHSGAYKKILDLGIPLITSDGTAKALGLRRTQYTSADSLRWKADSREFSITAFDTFHDCNEPLGFFITHNISGRTILFATDTGEMPDLFFEPDVFMIEANYDLDTLVDNVSNNSTNKALAERISDNHLSLEQAYNFIVENGGKGKMIIPLHASSNNLDFATQKDVFSELGKYIDVRKVKEIGLL